MAWLTCLCQCQQRTIIEDFLLPHTASFCFSVLTTFISFIYIPTLKDSMCCLRMPVCAYGGQDVFLSHLSPYCLKAGSLTVPGHQVGLDWLSTMDLPASDPGAGVAGTSHAFIYVGAGGLQSDRSSLPSYLPSPHFQN